MFPIFEEVARNVFPKISCIMDPMIFLIGPCIYFYFESQNRKISLAEFLPHTFIFFGYAIWLYAYLAWFYQPVDLANFTFGPQFWIIGGLKFGHLIFYLMLGRKSLRKLKQSGENIYSEFEKVNIAWGEQLLYGMIIIVYSAVLLYFFAIWNAMYSQKVDFLVLSMFTPFIYIASYHGITKSLALHNVYPSLDETAESQHQAAKKNQSVIQIVPEDLKKRISSKIAIAINEKQIFKNPSLTLEDLAEACGCSVHQMSYYLNNVAGQNFYDFINGYRIETIKEELLNPRNKHLNILAIAMDAGFNSKTAFNTVFKKYTGYTPSRFRTAHTNS